ncbi:MAG: sulfurtransferase [Deltaproteobacteria bacterium]|nr:sulfurtransferase [Deltaproteobacteria bacterium]
MQWKQFFTPVQAMDSKTAARYMEAKPAGTYTLLDVRQPKEYESAHIAGAKLIPVGELDHRLDELDPEKPAIVYCAIGGRSRIAAQMLSGKGFREVYNLSGGIRAWNDKTAVGPEDLGLHLFSGSETPAETITVAFGLEQGLRDFYLVMLDRVRSEEAKKLFTQLADIEILHQNQLLKLYQEITGAGKTREEFEKDVVARAMEGGLTTSDYLALYHPDLDSVTDILSLAMAIEAQALDLYERAAERSGNETSRLALLRIAREERAHLAQLGQLMDAMPPGEK